MVFNGGTYRWPRGGDFMRNVPLGGILSFGIYESKIKRVIACVHDN